MKKVLIIGTGFLGTCVRKEFKRIGFETFGTSLSGVNNGIKLDIRNIDCINKIVDKTKPNLVINCAANTKIDFLETNPDLAFSINSKGIENIAKITHKKGIRLIHISSDSVFDGKKGWYTESDAPNPINVYACSKLLGERSLVKNSSNYVIIRTNFYGYYKNNRFLFNSILDCLKKNKKIIGFNDIIFNPLEVSNLSRIITELAEKDFIGIIHAASDKTLTKYEFALDIAKILNLDKNLIQKGTSDMMNFIAKRPRNTSLDNKKLHKLIKTKIVSLQDWLKTMRNNYDL